MRKNNVKIKTGSTSEFFDRLRGHAEKLDRGESLPAEITIAFEDPMELLTSLRRSVFVSCAGQRRVLFPSLTSLPASSGMFAQSAAMWFFWKRQACCALAIARIQDTADSRS